MTDLVVVAADVLAGPVPTVIDVIWGATVAQGKSVYKDTADGDKWKPAGATTAAKAGADGVGIAMTAGTTGQPGRVLLSGNDVDLGVAAIQGVAYCVSGTADGGIEPIGDLLTGDYVTILGVGNASGNLDVDPLVSGSQVQ